MSKRTRTNNVTDNANIAVIDAPVIDAPVITPQTAKTDVMARILTLASKAKRYNFSYDFYLVVDGVNVPYKTGAPYDVALLAYRLPIIGLGDTETEIVMAMFRTALPSVALHCRQTKRDGSPYPIWSYGNMVGKLTADECDDIRQWIFENRIAL